MYTDELLIEWEERHITGVEGETQARLIKLRAYNIPSSRKRRAIRIRRTFVKVGLEFGHTVDELAQVLGVSRVTIFRDIQAIRQGGTSQC